VSSNLYPALVTLLKEAGCEFSRSGKGSHEIWKTPSGKKLIVPKNTGQRHTANGILKDAGLPKAF
jgi:predicted RNA binding protein YcfA (HicA-like mRNA interferase family)